MRRREFIGLLGGAAAWPIAARAQQPAMPVIGFLHSSSGGFLHQIAVFRQTLKDGGFVEGQNIAIEFRWAEDQYQRLPGLAAELVGRRVAVIFAAGGNISAVAAKAATSTIPIVFPAVADPVGGGLVASLNRPGGNVTGMSALSAELDAKRMELLRELVPEVKLIGALLNPNRPNPEVQLKGVQAAAQTVGLHREPADAVRASAAIAAAVADGPARIPKAISTRSPLSAHHRRSRYPRPSHRPQSRVIPRSNGNKIHATGTITA
jgi:putative ABC transport system substrate-binding protein